MKSKLSYKLFAAFVLMSFIIIVLTLVSYRFLTARNFWNFVNLTVLSRLEDFSKSLKSEYKTHQGWQTLKGNEERWLTLMIANMPKIQSDQPPPWAPQIKDNIDKKTAASNKLSNQPTIDHASNNGPHPPRRFARSLALFDENREYIVGSKDSLEVKDFTLKALKSDGQTIGWLGLRKIEYFSDPLLKAFIKGLSRTFIMLSGIILIIAALISYIMSRHLLTPVRQLAQATKSLSLFQFGTHINVRSKDELGQLAEDFNRMTDTLKKYEDLRQQWISDISHELRTPLSILKGEIEALQDGIRPLDQAQLASLHSEVLRLSKLVADLHDLSLADSKNLITQMHSVNPLILLKKIVSQFGERFNDHHIDVDLALGEDDGIVIEGDSNRIAQLFINLLENALRHTDPPGLLKIRENHGHQWLTILFEDSAPGVSDQELDLIFERLYRVDSSRNRDMGGSGLGLAICKQIVNSHGGTITAAQSEMGGLAIEIKLPRKIDESTP